MALSKPVSVAVFLAFLIAASLPARADAPARGDGNRGGEGKLFLWKVTPQGGGGGGGGADNVVYLLGSIHLGNEDFYPLPEPVEEAFKQAKAIAVEADITKVDMAELQGWMLKHGMYPAGDSLANHIDDDVTKQLRAWAKEQGMPVAALERFRPWLLALTITQAQMQKLGFKAELGIDHHLLTRAHAAKKEVRELESVDAQLKMLSGFPDDQQEAFLASSLDQSAEMKEQFGRMIEAWKTGDAAAMQKEIEAATEGHPEMKPLMEAMFDKRNVAMAAKVEGYLKEKGKGPVLVVVGAGHMVGETGLVTLLEKKGYQVEQASQAPAAAGDDEPARKTEKEAEREPAGTK